MKKLTKTQYWGIIYCSIWLLLVIHHIAVLIPRYKFIKAPDNPLRYVIFPSILLSGWMIIGLVKIFSKKDKKSSIVKFMVLLFLTIIFNTIFLQMEDYIIKSKIAATRHLLAQIQYAIDQTVEELDPQHTGNPELGDSYQQMLNGCDMGQWHYAKDPFSKALAQNIGINEYTELKYWLKNTDGYPIINVHRVDGKTEIELANEITW